MKKNLTFSLLMLLGLVACQKESTNVNNASTQQLSTGLMTPASTQPPNLVIMNLVSPNVWEGYYNGSGVKVTGPLYYDMVKYPTVVDGISVVANEISTYDGASVITEVTSNTEGNAFAVSVPVLGGTPSPGFQTDFNNYMTLWNTWATTGANGVPPLLSASLKPSYTTAGHSVTYTGKLIKVTTGSGLLSRLYLILFQLHNLYRRQVIFKYIGTTLILQIQA